MEKKRDPEVNSYFTKKREVFFVLLTLALLKKLKGKCFIFVNFSSASFSWDWEAIPPLGDFFLLLFFLIVNTSCEQITFSEQETCFKKVISLYSFCGTDEK